MFGILLDAMEGILQGKKMRGRPRIGMLDRTGMKYREMKDLAMEREAWRERGWNKNTGQSVMDLP